MPVLSAKTSPTLRSGNKPLIAAPMSPSLAVALSADTRDGGLANAVPRCYVLLL